MVRERKPQTTREKLSTLTTCIRNSTWRAWTRLTPATAMCVFHQNHTGIDQRPLTGHKDTHILQRFTATPSRRLHGFGGATKAIFYFIRVVKIALDAPDIFPWTFCIAQVMVSMQKYKSESISYYDLFKQNKWRVMASSYHF